MVRESKNRDHGVIPFPRSPYVWGADYLSFRGVAHRGMLGLTPHVSFQGEVPQFGAILSGNWGELPLFPGFFLRKRESARNFSLFSANFLRNRARRVISRAVSLGPIGSQTNSETSSPKKGETYAAYTYIGPHEHILSELYQAKTSNRLDIFGDQIEKKESRTRGT